MSQDPSHEGDVDEGGVVEVCFVPEYSRGEGLRCARLVCCRVVDGAGYAVCLVVGDFLQQLEELFPHAAVSVHHEWDALLVLFGCNLLVLILFCLMWSAFVWRLPWRA